jgi:predicted permease
MRDIRFGVRMLWKRPGTSLLAIAALALGIGLTTTMFSIVDAAFLRGLPFDEGDRIVALSRQQAGQQGLSRVPPHDFADWRAVQHTFEDLAGSTIFQANTASPGQPPERYRGARITFNTLALLRAQPTIGRDFSEADSRAGAPPVAIISDVMWQGRFERAPDVIGRTLRVNGVVLTIVGVMPPRFGFPNMADVWVAERLEFPDKRGEGRSLDVIGRLKSGVPLAEAQADMRTVARQLADQYPENKDITADVRPYTSRFLGAQIIATLSAMLAAVFGVLLIACVNVTNLQLARAAERMKEMAVRFALGATRGRVVRQLLVEGLLLSAAGAVLGLAIAYTGVTVFSNAVADTNPPFWMDFRVDGRGLLFVTALTVLAALASSLVPALRVSRQDVNSVLKDEGRSSTGVRVGLFSRVLVVVEMTLSFVLLVVSGLMIKSILTAGAVVYPFETNLFTARVSAPEQDYPSGDQTRQLFGRLQERMEAVPGVGAVATGTSAPDGGGPVFITIEGQPPAAEASQNPRVRTFEVSSNYLDVVRVPMRAGRGFNALDRAGAQEVAIVTEDFVRRFFPNGDALGRRIRLGLEPDRPWRTIVGVVPNLSVAAQPGDTVDAVLTPLAQSDAREVLFLVSSSAPLQMIGPALRLAVMEADPNLPVFDINTLEALFAQRTWPFRVFGGLFMTFGLAALVMAAAGLYGVMSFAVRRRTQEIGVRMALGADRGRITRMVVRQGLWQVGLGMIVGVGLGWLLGSSLQVLLFQVKPYDPAVFGGTIAVLGGVGLLASYVPALRAAAVDPLRALRHD